MSGEPSNETLKSMIDDLKEKSNERHAEYREIQTKMDKKLDIILEQTTKTNGRVTKLEDTFASMTKIIERHDKALFDEEGVVKSKDRVMWTIKLGKIILPLIILILSSLYAYWFRELKRSIEERPTKEEISQEVVSTLEEKYNLKINE